jgi:ABC-type sugar transport system permease subunit
VSLDGRILRFVGLSNYRALVASESFQDSWRNTLTFTGLFVPINLVVTLARPSPPTTKAGRPRSPKSR